MEAKKIAESLIEDYAQAVKTGRPNLIEGAAFRVRQWLDAIYPSQPDTATPPLLTGENKPSKKTTSKSKP